MRGCIVTNISFREKNRNKPVIDADKRYEGLLLISINLLEW